MTIRHRTLASSIAVLALLTLSFRAIADDAAKKKPIRALLITGGCCHDYAYQTKKLVEGSKKLANFEWTVLHDPRRGTKGKIGLYEKEAWGSDFDVVVHNECFAGTSDPEYIRKITKVHREGLPAVVIHCAMHTYRAAKIDDWREFLGVMSRRHDHQARYPIRNVAPKHPVMAGFPKVWTSPKDELYVVQKVWPNAKPLSVGKSERDGKDHAAFWVNQYGDARVFGTTFGHGNATFEDKVFIETVTRGLLWATKKITPDGKPAPGFEPVRSAKPATKPSSKTESAKLPAFPKGEKAVALFDGKSLAGWKGNEKFWSVENGTIVGKNVGSVKSSTYLFTEKSYRDFRLLFDVRQTRSKEHSTMHSAVAVLGELRKDREDEFGFHGPLLMFCQDWGIWDAYRRNRVEPKGHRAARSTRRVSNRWASGTESRFSSSAIAFVSWRTASSSSMCATTRRCFRIPRSVFSSIRIDGRRSFASADSRSRRTRRTSSSRSLADCP